MSEFQFEEKGKVQPKRPKSTAEPQKTDDPQNLGSQSNRLSVETVTQMQQTVGNSAVQRLLAQRVGEGAAEIEDETAEAIQAKTGGGQELDEGMAAQAGNVMGQDFSDVRVHTDSKADELSQNLTAKAFTTGNDIFFKDGTYNPGSSSGQQLIAHELTHVVQQGASPPAVQGKMMVNDPNDQYESEADAVADMVLSQPEEVVAQRQELEEEEIAQAQEMEEEELEQG